MARGSHPDFSGWLVTSGDPRQQRVLVHPRRARVTAATYAGDTVTVEVDVVATAPGQVCVRQEIPGRAPWLAWVPSGAAVPM
jgi:hypothetical protein